MCQSLVETEIVLLRIFTAEELALYDGTGGHPAYIAYHGQVYDVSSGPNWAAGAHYEHNAGEELSDAMEDAPHGDDVMERFPIVGELAP